MDTARLRAIQERVEKATNLPWYATPHTEDDEWAVGRGVGAREIAQMVWNHDAPFIAHAREDVPWLLQQLAEAEARIATLEGEKAELLARAFKFNDKPHQLFSQIKVMAEGHPDATEIRRLMDYVYHHIDNWSRRHIQDWGKAELRATWERGA